MLKALIGKHLVDSHHGVSQERSWYAYSMRLDGEETSLQIGRGKSDSLRFFADMFILKFIRNRSRDSWEISKFGELAPHLVLVPKWFH